jgi:hypothetical protein
LARERERKRQPRLLAQAPQSDERGIGTAVGPKHVTTTARFFQGVLYPLLLLRALVGEKLKQLREEVGLHVAHRVKFSVERYERPW